MREVTRRIIEYHLDPAKSPQTIRISKRALVKRWLPTINGVTLEVVTAAGEENPSPLLYLDFDKLRSRRLAGPNTYLMPAIMSEPCADFYDEWWFTVRKGRITCFKRYNSRLSGCGTVVKTRR